MSSQKLAIFLSACLMGCSVLLPNKPANIADYVPVIEQEKADFVDFSVKNFPGSCEWTSLVRVVDGDTIVVGENIRVRLIGIDTPEIKHPNKPIEPFGIKASETLKNLLKNSPKICLITDNVGDDIDKYGRRLAYIFTTDGVDINAELLKLGMAKAYLYFPFERNVQFKYLYEQARESKVGRWE